MFNKKFFIYTFLVVLIILISFIALNKNGDYETYVVEKSRFVDTAEISGKIVPAQDLNLAFEVVGKISKINVETGDFVKEGDVIAELDSSEISSELSEVVANLEKERSRLSEVSGLSTNQNELENSAESLLSTIEKSYVISDDIIKNIVDKFFDNPNSRSPEFSTVLSNFFLRDEINSERFEVGKLLLDWKKEIDILDAALVDNEDVTKTISNLKKIETFLAKISSEVDDYSPAGNVTQSQIDAYVSNISSSRSSVSSLVIEVNNIYNDFRNVKAELPVLQASVDNARASVSKLSARKSKYVLIAPFSGIITEQNIETGQVVSVNENIISMISEDSFEIEGFVPELSIIGVNVGDKANLKLDAFGKGVVFDSEVSHVDPRETFKDGVTTYRILLSLLEKNEDIRSGMTVDIEIEKDYMNDQVIIPKYLILEDEKGSYVFIVENGEKIRKNISLGESDNKGRVIVEGVSVGDKIVIQK
jgi:RND family efflux transporter MFP subunit